MMRSSDTNPYSGKLSKKDNMLSAIELAKLFKNFADTGQTNEAMNIESGQWVEVICKLEALKIKKKIMKLSEEANKALDIVRAKVIKCDLNFSGVEADCIGLVFQEIQAQVGVKVSSIIDRSCNSCIVTAVNIVKNYINHHEVKEIDRKAVVIQVSGTIKLSDINENTPAGIYSIDRVDPLQEVVSFVNYGSDNTYPEKVAELYDTNKVLVQKIESDESFVVGEFSTTGYEKMKQKELVDLCKDRGIKYPRNPKKDELIKLLNENK